MASDSIDYYKGKMTPERKAEVIEKCTPYWKNRAKYERFGKQVRYLVQVEKPVLIEAFKLTK